MPIYEFFCVDCNTVFNFFSRRPDTVKRPACPKCGKPNLQKMMSSFATIGKAKDGDGDDPFAGMDEAKMEQAMAGLMREAENLNEEDPRQMAQLMRKFADRSGLNLGGAMEEAIARMEAGEDPEQVEQEMGDLLEGDEPLSLDAMKKKVQAGGKRPPAHDDKLYDL